MINELEILAVLDPFNGYNFRKDTSHLLLLRLAERGHRICYTDPTGLSSRDAEPAARCRPAKPVPDSPYFILGEEGSRRLDRFDLILMRKDPPVDAAYLTALQLLDRARIPVFNRPASLARFNEKLSTLLFPDWIPRTVVSADRDEIERFRREAGGVAVLKSLDTFGGRGVRKRDRDEPELVGALTRQGRLPVLVQEYLPVERGEKRIFLIGGEPAGALLRYPPAGSFLTDPDRGGRIAPATLTPRERQLCAELAPFLKQNGLWFTGIDVIDGRLTDINITSPGLVWEWNEVDGVDHSHEITERLEKLCAAS